MAVHLPAPAGRAARRERARNHRLCCASSAVQLPTPNAQRPTPNAGGRCPFHQPSRTPAALGVGSSKLGVGRLRRRHPQRLNRCHPSKLCWVRIPGEKGRATLCNSRSHRLQAPQPPPPSPTATGGQPHGHRRPAPRPPVPGGPPASSSRAATGTQWPTHRIPPHGHRHPAARPPDAAPRPPFPGGAAPAFSRAPTVPRPHGHPLPAAVPRRPAVRPPGTQSAAMDLHPATTR